MAVTINLSEDGRIKRTDTEENVTLANVSGVTAANVAALTDSSGGTANDTVVEVTDTTSDVSALINANFADVTAKINDILAALKAAGIMAADA